MFLSYRPLHLRWQSARAPKSHVQRCVPRSVCVALGPSASCSQCIGLGNIPSACGQPPLASYHIAQRKRPMPGHTDSPIRCRKKRYMNRVISMLVYRFWLYCSLPESGAGPPSARDGAHELARHCRSDSQAQLDLVPLKFEQQLPVLRRCGPHQHSMIAAVVQVP